MPLNVSLISQHGVDSSISLYGISLPLFRHYIWSPLVNPIRLERYAALLFNYNPNWNDPRSYFPCLFHSTVLLSSKSQYNQYVNNTSIVLTILILFKLEHQLYNSIQHTSINSLLTKICFEISKRYHRNLIKLKSIDK